MHFDAALLFIDPGFMRELTQVEVRIEFAIDAGQKIQVESGCDTKFIVVCREQLVGWFLKIRAQKK